MKRKLNVPRLKYLIGSAGVDPIESYSRSDRFPKSPYRTGPINIKLNLKKIGFIRRNR